MSIKSELMNEVPKGPQGQLKPQNVVTWARANPTSALHGQFPWDVEEAAKERWLDIARGLISVHVRYDHDEAPVEHQVRATLSLRSDRGSPSGSYHGVDHIIETPRLMAATYNDAIAELVAFAARFKGKYAIHTGLEGIIRRLDDVAADAARHKQRKDSAGA